MANTKKTARRFSLGSKEARLYLLPAYSLNLWSGLPGPVGPGARISQRSNTARKLRQGARISQARKLPAPISRAGKKTKKKKQTKKRY